MDNIKNEIHAQITKEYEKIRAENEASHQQILNKIYTHVPRIKEIDKELSNIGLSVCGAVLDGAISPAKAVSDMRIKSENLIEEKRCLLRKIGVPDNFTDEVYACKRCKDKGHVDNKHCICYYQKLQKIMQKMSNVCSNTDNSFEKYNLALYSSAKDENYGISPYDNAKTILSLALCYAKAEVDTPKNLLFYGATGLGKTFTSDCIAKKYIENGKSVFYMSAPKLFSCFEEYKFGRDTSQNIKNIIDSAYNVELLIIDDLGTEFRSSYVDSILFDVVNTRLNECKNMIISTNLTPSQLASTYSDRISSRILGGFEKVLFFGEDIRIKNSYQ